MRRLHDLGPDAGRAASRMAGTSGRYAVTPESAARPLERRDSIEVRAHDLARLRLVEVLEELGVDRDTAWLYVNGEADPPADILRALAARCAEEFAHAA